MNERKKVLFCPLDWGLGHATRSFPVIQELIRKGCDVSVATSGPALTLLKKELPDLMYYSIAGYRPFYSASRSQTGSMFIQLPKFIRTINQEHEEIERIVEHDRMDAVISDNRFGCWSKRVPSVMITHQLNIQAPMLLSGLINSWNRRQIRKFSVCWVPDYEGNNSLAGSLTVAHTLPVTYIGPLSRFRPDEPIDKKYEIIALVSGPEPQRRMLEELLHAQLKRSGRTALLVQGLPGEEKRFNDGSLSVVSHLGAVELNKAILESELVISRPGYSTIMDLSVLGRKAIFIPTPGQTEQEYLGREFMTRNIALCVSQENFDLDRALGDAVPYTGFPAGKQGHLLQKAIDTLLI